MAHDPVRSVMASERIDEVRVRSPLAPAPVDARCATVVAVPARDEAATIGATLAALAAQRDRRGRALDPRRYEVLVVANNCADATAAIAREAARAMPSLRVQVVEVALASHEAHSGRARQLAMDAAWHRLAASHAARRVIATTDADSVVAPDWIAATRREIARGADVVGGRIVAASLDRLPAAARELYLYDAGYHHLAAALDALIDPDPHDPWPRHHQHFGASLAVTADAYARVGGLEAVEALEDVRFYERALRAGLRVRHSPHVRVRTSTRCRGRAHVGLATQLAEWVDVGRARRAWPVESAAFLERWALTRRRLRRLHTRLDRGAGAWVGGEQVARLAARLRLTSSSLRETMLAAPSVDACIARSELRQRFVRGWNEARHGARFEDVRAAVEALRIRVSDWKARPQRRATTSSRYRSALEPAT